MTRSHIYEFSTRELLEVVLPPLGPLVLFSLWMHLGAATGSLPRPCPILDTDRTILFHQAAASQERHEASLLLIGDSSCLMDVSAEQLGRLPHRPRSALNLGTLSYLDLDAFAAILRHYLAANPTPPETIVLLMHPEALRRAAPEEYDVQALAHFYAGTDYCSPVLPRLLCVLGVETFRGRFLGPSLPQRLPGAFGRVYGFTHDLWDYLSKHRGSALDPGQFDPATVRGNAEYRLAKDLERTSRSFRAAVPDGVKLTVGITPLPESLATADYRQTCEHLLQTWSEWLGADLALTGLPPVLPDALFASPTHLNAEGVRVYTGQLDRELARLAGSSAPRQ